MKRVYVDASTALARRDFDAPERQALAMRAHRLSLPGDLDRLHALDQLAAGAIEVYPHQVEAVLRALGPMAGRAMLADEVGLGKTIEAGLAIKEYLCRQLARRVLVLVPAPLVPQWRGELLHKFDEPFAVAPTDGWDAPRLIASLDAAKQPETAEGLLAQEWDLVVVDEAHRLRNPQTQAHRFVKQLRTRHLLLLTATPVQNRLEDLHALVDLLEEGLLGTPNSFREAFVADKHGRVLKDAPRLAGLLSRRMVRHRRSEVGIAFPKRLVEAVLVPPGEGDLHAWVEAYVRKAWPAARGERALTLVRLARMAASSPRALAASLEGERGHVAAEDLPELEALVVTARTAPSAKLAALRQVLDRVGGQALVFTAFRETQAYLAEALTADGRPVVTFHGGLSRTAKQEALDAFRADPDAILLATDAGSEGINLQGCRTLVNYDLPWNPMRVEQRIGRVHRLGQTRDVLVFNLAIAGTIEARVLRVLEEKIALFTAAVGETEPILGQLRGLEALEATLMDMLARDGDLTELEGRLDEAKVAAAEVAAFDAHVFGALTGRVGQLSDRSADGRPAIA